MEIELSETQREIESSVRKITQKFPDEYWHECDEASRFPEEFYGAMAEAGWLGITMPEELGGAGLGQCQLPGAQHLPRLAAGGLQPRVAGVQLRGIGGGEVAPRLAVAAQA